MMVPSTSSACIHDAQLEDAARDSERLASRLQGLSSGDKRQFHPEQSGHFRILQTRRDSVRSKQTVISTGLFCLS